MSIKKELQLAGRLCGVVGFTEEIDFENALGIYAFANDMFAISNEAKSLDFFKEERALLEHLNTLDTTYAIISRDKTFVRTFMFDDLKTLAIDAPLSFDEIQERLAFLSSITLMNIQPPKSASRPVQFQPQVSIAPPVTPQLTQQVPDFNFANLNPAPSYQGSNQLSNSEPLLTSEERDALLSDTLLDDIDLDLDIDDEALPEEEELPQLNLKKDTSPYGIRSLADLTLELQSDTDDDDENLYDDLNAPQQQPSALSRLKPLEEEDGQPEVKASTNFLDRVRRRYTQE